MHRAIKIFLCAGVILISAFACMASKIVPVAKIKPNTGKAIPVCASYGKPQIAAQVQSDKLQEISGMDISSAYPNILWAHNDSGDGPFIYALSLSGETLGRIELPGIKAWDWEDMAIGPCGEKECFYIGDIGDNRKVRSNYAIYRVPLPNINPEKPFGNIVAKNVRRLSIKYPDGHHNAEALAVRPDGTLLILIKERGKSTLFDFGSLEKETGKPIAVLELGEKYGDKVTAADIHPKGDKLLFRTYNGAFEWSLDESTKQIPVPAAKEQQGEAIAYDPVRGGYWHVSEGYKPYLYYIGCDKLTQ